MSHAHTAKPMFLGSPESAGVWLPEEPVPVSSCKVWGQGCWPTLPFCTLGALDYGQMTKPLSPCSWCGPGPLQSQASPCSLEGSLFYEDLPVRTFSTPSPTVTLTIRPLPGSRHSCLLPATAPPRLALVLHFSSALRVALKPYQHIQGDVLAMGRDMSMSCVMFRLGQGRILGPE
jgi:hypothetical protein